MAEAQQEAVCDLTRQELLGAPNLVIEGRCAECKNRITAHTNVGEKEKKKPMKRKLTDELGREHFERIVARRLTGDSRTDPHVDFDYKSATFSGYKARLGAEQRKLGMLMMRAEAAESDDDLIMISDLWEKGTLTPCSAKDAWSLLLKGSKRHLALQEMVTVAQRAQKSHGIAGLGGYYWVRLGSFLSQS